jgi:rRNA-processing protein FCF1
MKKIITDTNFLLMPFECGVDLAGELQRIVHGPLTLLVPSIVFAELRMLEGKTGKNAAAARFFLQNLGKFRLRFPVEEVKSTGAADEWILKYARENPVTVATNDIPLRKRLLALGVPVIAMKGKSKLDFV